MIKINKVLWIGFTALLFYFSFFFVFGGPSRILELLRQVLAGHYESINYRLLIPVQIMWVGYFLYQKLQKRTIWLFVAHMFLSSGVFFITLILLTSQFQKSPVSFILHDLTLLFYFGLNLPFSAFTAISYLIYPKIKGEK